MSELNIHSDRDPGDPRTYCTQKLDFTIGNDGEPVTILDLTFHDAPDVPWPNIWSRPDQVNSATFLGAAAGLVTFKGGSTKEKVNSDGTTVYEVHMTFEERGPSRQ